MEELAREKPPFLAVRRQREFKEGRLPEATPEELRERLTEIPQDRPVVLQCGTGCRSYVAQQILLNSGLTDVRNLYGGYDLAKRVYSMISK